jgi:hypothetical protein
MKAVKSVTFNWHQAGSTMDRDGAGENFDRSEVGKNGVTEIIENVPMNGMQLWNYEVHDETGIKTRIFNPNFVEYYTPKP